MSKPYIKNNYGDSCFFRDTPLKQYNRYRASHGDTFVINFGCCGYTGGHYSMGCCNHGSFWGGFGAGIAQGIANLFGGFMCGFMNIPFFGGLFGRSSFGMPHYGGLLESSTFGIPYSYIMEPSYLGLGGPDGSSNGSNSSGSGSGASGTGSGKDLDAAKLNELRGKFKEEISKPSPKIDKLQELYNNIKGLSENPLDNANRDDNKESYKQLLDEFKSYVDFNGDVISKTKDLESSQNKSLVNQLYADLDLPTGVTPSDLFTKGIKPTLLQYNNGKVIMGLTMPRDPSDPEEMELLAKCGEKGICVAFQHNSNDNAYDNWIIGTVKNITKTTDNKLESYKIDCSLFEGSKHGHTYKLTPGAGGNWTNGVNLHNESDSSQSDKTLNWSTQSNVYERGSEQGNYHKSE